MRALPILLLAAGLTLVGCDGNPPTGEAPTGEPPTGEPPTGEPPTDGTLVVSTSTVGDDPDLNGYLLMVDDAYSRVLRPTGSAQVDLAPGRHTLELLGVAEQCSVAPRTVLELDVARGSTTLVAFEVNCPLTGARITVTTTGLSLDPDGYRVMVDGSDHGVIASNGTVLAQLEPGSRMIGLTGLAPNCAVDGSSWRTVTIVDTEAVAVEFEVVCTAPGGVIKVVMSGALGLGFEGIVDGVSRFPIGVFGRGLFSGLGYLAGVPAGTHVVSLSAPTDCSSEPGPQSVTMPQGAPLRDTVEVTFSVTCVSGLRITTRTTGPKASYYWAALCSDPWCDGLPFYAGQVGPNGTLVFKPGTDTYWVGLTVPRSNCVKAQNPPNPIPFGSAGSLEVTFQVTCS
jgi:hypothetical protein